MSLRRQHIRLHDCDTGKALDLLVEVNQFSVIVSMRGQEVIGMDYWSEGESLRVLRWDGDGEVEGELRVEVNK